MFRISLIILALSSSGIAFADTVPDIRGTWVGTSNAAVRGSSRHHPGNTMDQITFNNKEIFWSIDHQEGRNFHGKVTSKHATEPLIGAFGGDLKSGVIANSDGVIDFALVGTDQIHMCYSHANEKSVVVNCIDFKRKN